jgi:hypothetical protein
VISGGLAVHCRLRHAPTCSAKAGYLDVPMLLRNKRRDRCRFADDMDLKLVDGRIVRRRGMLPTV